MDSKSRNVILGKAILVASKGKSMRSKVVLCY
jgi:hypothetical protein